MIKDNLRAALYARVSGEQQEKEDTIASQLEALTQRIATEGSECEPELHFVDVVVQWLGIARATSIPYTMRHERFASDP
jgi:hypothetical protein